MDNSFDLAVMGLIITILGQLGKKIGLKFDYFILLFAVLCGVLYTGFGYLPVTIQESVVLFVTSSIGSAALVYAFFLKALPRIKQAYDQLHE